MLASGCNRADKEAGDIISRSGIRGGLVSHIGCAGGKLTASLHRDGSFLVHGLATESEDLERARKHIRGKGLYGQVSVEMLEGKTLPYTDNLVNLAVLEEASAVSAEEAMRVLSPGGVLMTRKENGWEKKVKPRPDEMDDWTHYMHGPDNNAVSRDLKVGIPRRLQWTGGSRWSRHHDRMASMSAMVSSKGKVFYIFDEGPTSSIILPSEWALFARDAFNGTLLWRKPIEHWQSHFWPYKSGPAQITRRLVAVDDKVYVTLGLHAPVSELDASTGDVIREFEGTEKTREIIVSDNILYAMVNTDTAYWESIERITVVDHPGRMKDKPWKNIRSRLVAVDLNDGSAIWQKDTPVLPVSMAAGEKQLLFHNGEDLVCLDKATGEEVWTAESMPRWNEYASFYAVTLLIKDGVVLYSGGENMKYHQHGWDTMYALSAETGEILWTAEHPPSGYQSPEDVLVAGGLVWTAPIVNGSYEGTFTGRDLHTGEVVKEIPPEVETYWFHHRCYPAKATENFLLTSRTGIECIDLENEKWTINHWVRGGCLYGIMPANGLIYAPPHDCACYPESKLYGFCALAPGQQNTPDPWSARNTDRLVRGEAWDEPVEENMKATGEDWPTYRHDPARSGNAGTEVGAGLEKEWEAGLSGKLSSLTVANGMVFLSRVDAHELLALDEQSGRTLWKFTTGGRIDSPPTAYKGSILFGSADGWVYCLRAADGKLIWKYMATPLNMKLSAYGQLESVWPVHGNILVEDGVACFVAGRSMFLNGGMRLIRLDPETGETISETVLDENIPGTGKTLQDNIMILNMPVALPDILSSDGQYMYMRSQRFDKEGNRLEPGPHSGNPSIQGSRQKGEGRHLFAPYGFLDDSWFHRSYWVYGKSFAGGHGGYHQAGKFTPCGRIMVFDDENVYSFARRPEYYRWISPLEYHLYSADRTEVIDTVTPPGETWGRQPARSMEFHWSDSIPLLARAMVKAGENIFVAGPPDLVNENEALRRIHDPEMKEKLEQQKQALEGKQGGLLLAVSASDGKILAKYELGAQPVWDGMAAANKKLFLATKDGRVMCFAGKEQ